MVFFLLRRNASDAAFRQKPAGRAYDAPPSPVVGFTPPTSPPPVAFGVSIRRRWLLHFMVLHYEFLDRNCSFCIPVLKNLWLHPCMDVYVIVMFCNQVTFLWKDGWFHVSGGLLNTSKLLIFMHLCCYFRTLMCSGFAKGATRYVIKILTVLFVKVHAGLSYTGTFSHCSHLFRSNLSALFLPLHRTGRLYFFHTKSDWWNLT